MPRFPGRILAASRNASARRVAGGFPSGNGTPGRKGALPGDGDSGANVATKTQEFNSCREAETEDEIMKNPLTMSEIRKLRAEGYGVWPSYPVRGNPDISVYRFYQVNWHTQKAHRCTAVLHREDGCLTYETYRIWME